MPASIINSNSTKGKTMLKLLKRHVSAVLLVASAITLDTTVAMAKPVSDFLIIVFKQGDKPQSFKTGKNGYVWQVVEPGKYVIRAADHEGLVEVGREGKLWIKVDQNGKGQITIKADGGEKPVSF
jgi:hypothetical protein